MLEETGTKVSLSTVKRVLYRHNLKGHSARKKALLQNRHKKARLWFATAHEDKDCTFWRNVFWWNKNITVWPLWPLSCLEEKEGGLQAEEHHPNSEARGGQHHVVGVLCFVDILKQHLKTSVRKLTLGRKCLFQMGNDPKHTFKVVAQWIKDNQVKVMVWPSQSPTNLTQLHQLWQEEWAKIHPTYCGKFVEGYLTRLTQEKQF